MYKFSIYNTSRNGILAVFFQLLLLIYLPLNKIYAQEVIRSGTDTTDVAGDTLRPPGQDLIDTTLIRINDTLTTRGDTVLQTAVPGASPIDQRVDYEALDSMRFDMEAKKIYLYGKAKVVYGNITLTAGYIELNMDQNLLYATGIKDSTGATVDLPVFAEDGSEFTAATMLYNFNTRRGLITDVITQEGEGYIHGGRVKKFEDDHLFIEDGKYTTCNHPEPHFYIRSEKLKVIPNDKVITGPAYLMIEEVPTPLALPFGYFPNKQGRASGILIPQYGESPMFGFYLMDGGYYFTLSEHFDLALRGDIYSKGSWAVKGASNYKKRYRYNGFLEGRFSQNIFGYREFTDLPPSNNFLVRWRHALDPKARPGVNFSADVTAGSSNYNRFNTGTSTDFLNSSMQSNISWSKAFAGTPFMIALNASHAQNTQDSTVSITLPSATVAMSRIYPFRDLGGPGRLKWLKKFGVNYTGTLNNNIFTRDTSLFERETLDRMQTGINHNVQASTSANLGAFTFSPAATFTSAWVTKTMRRDFDTLLDRVVTDTVQGLSMNNVVSLNGTFTTKVYGMYQFKETNAVQAIRHTMTPSFGFRYVPLLSEPMYYTDTLGQEIPYSIYEGTPVSPPALVDQGLITFGLAQSLEMKARSGKDTVTGVRKFALIDNISANASYNIFAEEFQLSPIVVAGQTNLFNRISVNLGGTFDPYHFDENGVRVNEFVWDHTGAPARLVGANLAIGFSFSSKRGLNQQQPPGKTTAEEIDMINAAPGNYVDFDIPWSFTVSYNLNYSRPAREVHRVQGIQVNGDLNLTPKWKIGVRSGYDFVAGDLTHTAINIYRDLHCWEMRFDWIPFGSYRGYSVQINVKSSVLQDLKLSRKRYWNDFQTFN